MQFLFYFIKIKNHTFIKSLSVWCWNTDNNPASNKSLIHVVCLFCFLSSVIGKYIFKSIFVIGFMVGLKSGALAGYFLPFLVVNATIHSYCIVSRVCESPTSSGIIFTSTLISHILIKFIITCISGSSLFTVAKIMNVTRSLKVISKT